MRFGIFGALFITAFTLIVTSCGKSIPSPRQRVLEFVRLIKADSLPDILPYIVLDSVASYEYASPKYANLDQQQKKDRLLKGFVRQGEYRGVWSKSQIVVNEEEMINDSTAAVEVSFIDRSTRIQYYSKMGMRKQAQTWMIYRFNVFDKSFK